MYKKLEAGKKILTVKNIALSALLLPRGIVGTIIDPLVESPKDYIIMFPDFEGLLEDYSNVECQTKNCIILFSSEISEFKERYKGINDD